MPKIKALSPILYNKVWQAGEVFEVPDHLAVRLVDNGAAVVYTEGETVEKDTAEATAPPPPSAPETEAGD